MATLTRDSESPFWLSPKAVAAMVLGLAVIKLYVSAHVGLAFDEGYYTFWSERLQPGYYDHPPAVAAMIALGRSILGNNELGVRAVAVVAGVALSGLLYRTGALLLDRRTAALAVLWYNAAPAAGLNFITTPDPPSALFWMATLWAVAEFMASRRAAWWLVAGVMAGLGLWSKYTVAFLVPGLLLFLLTSRERREWLKLWQVWAGAGLAVVVFAPVIRWNAQHDWASFRLQGGRTVTESVSSAILPNLADLVAGQAAFMVPVLFGFALAGIGQFLRRPGEAGRRGLALPVLTALPALAYFLFHTLHDRVEANWLIPLWPPLALAAAWAAQRLGSRAKSWEIGATFVQIAAGLGLTLFVYVQALYQPFALGDLDRTNETRGWPGVEQWAAGLAAENGAHWIATAGGYATTGELASYLLFAGSALPLRQVNEAARWQFLPPFDADATGWPALFVQVDPNPAAPQPPTALFGAARPAGSFRRDAGHGEGETWSAFVVSQPTPQFYAGLKE